MNSKRPQSLFQTTINAPALRRYDVRVFTLIPLHAYDAKAKKRGKVRKLGKAPIDKNWSSRTDYNSARVRDAAIKANRNVGVRLNPDQLVIDVDPRNGGDDSFKGLCAALKLVPENFPTVITGSGGLHVYMTKPADLLIVDTLPDFPGVEFKSKGRQVVAAGSIHPDTLKLYEWDAKAPGIEDGLPAAPQGLLNVIARPARDHVIKGGGQMTQEQVEDALARLNPEDFRDHDDWLHIMMACHHGSNGDARGEFVEWSTSDPHYAEDSEWIGRRWDSLHTERPGGDVITYRSLLKAVREKGDCEAFEFIDHEERAEDFEALAAANVEEMSFEGAEPAPEKSELSKLNETYCAVFGSGRCRIMYRERHTGGLRWTAASKQDFMSRFENQRIETGGEGKPATVPLGKAWQEWPGRKTADGTVFDTRAEPAAIVGGALNLWSGFAIEPKRGTCERFKAMILNDLCSGDAKVFDYVLRWIAWKIQHPGKLPEVAIALPGPKNVGKTTLGMTLKKIFGEHGMVARDINQIAGRFNGHLETKCFVYADEAVWGGDKSNESALKALVTDSEAAYEYKGVQIFSGVNHVGLIFAGNEKWIVPATMDERRFCVAQVSGQHMVPDDAPKDHPNRLYWNAIHRELDNGGREAFLYEMQHVELGNWHPRVAVPRTAALGEQKLQGLSGFEKWYHELLRDGIVNDVVVDGTDGDWAAHGLYASPGKVTVAYSDWLRLRKPHAVVTTRALLADLKSFGWDGGEHCRLGKKRDRYWSAPDLATARKLFAERIGVNPFTD